MSNLSNSPTHNDVTAHKLAGYVTSARDAYKNYRATAMKSAAYCYIVWWHAGSDQAQAEQRKWLEQQITDRNTEIDRHNAELDASRKELAKSNLAGREFEPVDHAGLRQQMYAIRDAEEPELRDCCPACGSLSIQYRKRAATWICNSTSTGRYCAHVFDVPAKKPALTPDQKKSIRTEKYRAWRSTILNREDDWMRDAMLAWIDAMRVYLSLKHTKTLCKRCAFLEDMTEDRACRSCGYAYPKTDQICPDCRQPDTQVEASPT